MVQQVIWHGTDEQAAFLVHILEVNCKCDIAGGRKALCAGHKALVFDQRFADGMVFGQALRERFIEEEWTLKCRC